MNNVSISVFVTEPIAAEDAVSPATLKSLNDNPPSLKFTDPDGFVVASLNALTTPSEASLTSPANLLFEETSACPTGVTDADVTSAASLKNVKN
jgi:hypothetical protein